jgi:methylamine utilization protein MauE
MVLGGIGVLSPVLNTIREVQIPLLAALLIGGCAAKAKRAIGARSIEAALSPSMMFPLRLHRPITIGLIASELVLGIGLLATAGRFGAGVPAMAVRSAVALLFVTAVGALHVLRSRRPEAGCGCFGDLSDTPVSWRALGRSVLLFAAAIGCVGVPPLRMPTSTDRAVLLLVVLAVELGALIALSPEVSEVMVRLGYSEPCEVRRLPMSRTLSALHASSHWRRYRKYITAMDPSDMWREGCWRYVVFPGIVAERPVEVIFAVYQQPRRPPVRAAIIDATPGEAPARVVPAQRPAPAILPAPVFIAAPTQHRSRHSAGL